MRLARRFLLALPSMAVAFALGCGDYSVPSASAPLARGGDAANWLEPVYVTAPYTYYCMGYYGLYKCSNSDGEEIADLNQPQLNQYCRDGSTAQYCFFNDGGGDGYTLANPTVEDDAGDEMYQQQSPPDTLPNCSQAQSELKKHLWCTGSTPAVGDHRYNRIQAAILKIRDVGNPHCTMLADELQRLFNNGLIRTFPKNAPGANFQGFAPNGALGSGGSFMGISDYWADIAFDDSHVYKRLGNKINLQLILVHEADHLAGYDHLSSSEIGKIFTTNTALCSGQGQPVNL
jgi:hypothetical protein